MPITSTSDFTLTWSQKTHTGDCATKKQEDRWLYISREYLFTHWLAMYPTVLYQFTHTIGDCIGFHVEDTPKSEMVAKISLHKDTTFHIKNPNYKKLECDCDGEVTEHDLSNRFTTEGFITAVKDFTPLDLCFTEGSEFVNELLNKDEEK